MEEKKKEVSKKLKDFAEITVGYRLPKASGNCEAAFSYKLFHFGKESVEKDMVSLSCETEIPSVYLTRIGDIIVNSKTMDITFIEKEKQKNLLVSDKYMLIRCYDENVLPKYIFLEMRKEKCPGIMRAACRGCGLSFQKVEKLKDLKFKLPEKSSQEDFCQIYEKLNEVIRNIDAQYRIFADKIRREKQEITEELEKSLIRSAYDRYINNYSVERNIILDDNFNYNFNDYLDEDFDDE